MFAEWFDRRFTAEGSAARAVSEKAYMKSALTFHGVTAPQIRRACAELCRAHELDRASLRALVDEMYATDSFSLRSAGLVVAERRVKLLGAADADWLVGIARASACWAHVDLLATKLLGPVVAGAPRLAAKLRRWGRDPDFWVRRTALLAQLDELRAGRGDFDLFEELAAPLLEEKEFFIRKAIGWVVRDVSRRRPELSYGFLRRHRARLSGLTLREGAKHLGATQRKALGL